MRTVNKESRLNTKWMPLSEHKKGVPGAAWKTKALATCWCSTAQGMDGGTLKRGGLCTPCQGHFPEKHALS